MDGAHPRSKKGKDMRKQAKYFTRREAEEIARLAFLAGQRQGMKDANSIYWHARPDQDTEAAFIEWLNQEGLFK